MRATRQKAVLALAVLVVMGLVLKAATATAATKVFLLAGESNMAGYGGYGTEANCPAPYSQPPSRVKIWNDPDARPDPGNNDGIYSSKKDGLPTLSGWIDLRPGFGEWFPEDNGNRPTFGPELSFGYRLHQLYPNDDIYLVKYGYGGSTLGVMSDRNHWNYRNNWYPTGTGLRYAIFKTRVNRALQNLRDAGLFPTIVGIALMNGMNDERYCASTYPTNLANFIRTLRSDFGPNLRIVIARCLPYSKVPADNDTVRNAQMTVPDQVGNASWFDTDDLPRRSDGAHYGTKGQIQLGVRFAEQFAPTSR